MNTLTPTELSQKLRDVADEINKKQIEFHKLRNHMESRGIHTTFCFADGETGARVIQINKIYTEEDI